MTFLQAIRELTFLIYDSVSKGHYRFPYEIRHLTYRQSVRRLNVKARKYKVIRVALK